MLSGYLITRLLLVEREKRGRVALRAFYVRRFLRLYPALLVVLAGSPLLLWATGDKRLEDYPPMLAAVAFYLSDFFQASGVDFTCLSHTWSLSMEEQFYIVWPALLLVLLRVDPRAPREVSLAALVGTWPRSHSHGLAFENMLSLISVVTGPLAVPYAAHGRSWLLNFRPLTWIGLLSYGTYLWHAVLLRLDWGLFDLTCLARFTMVLVSVGNAAPSWCFIELPILRHKKRWERASIIDQAQNQERPVAPRDEVASSL